MRKSILLSFLCLLCVFVTHAETQEWEISSWSQKLSTGDNTLAGKVWNCTTIGYSTNDTSGKTYVIVGSGNNKLKSLVLSSSDFEGTIKSISISASKYATKDASISMAVKVGGIQIGEEETIDDANSCEYNFVASGDLQGKIEIDFNSSGSRLKLYQIIVEYDPDPVDPNKLSAPVFNDPSGNEISGEYTIYSKTGGKISVSCETAGATISVSSQPENAISYNNGIITIYSSCTITAKATKGDQETSSSIDVIVDKSPTPPVFHGTDGTPITEDSYTFTSISNTEITATYETDATGSIAFYEPNSSTPVEDVVTDLQSANGKFTFKVVKPCTVEVTSTRDGLSSSSSVTFYGPKPTSPVFYDSNQSPISGTYLYSPTDEAPTCIVYAECKDNTTSSTYSVNYPTAVKNAEEVVVNGKKMWAFEVANSCVITITAKNAFDINSSSLSITISKKQKFVKFTKDDHLQLGGLYLIVNATSPVYTISPNPNTSNAELNGVNNGVTVNDDGSLLVEMDKVAVFTLVEGKTDYALQYQTGEYLTLAASTAKGYNSSKDAKDEYANVTISQGTSYATIKFTKHGRLLRYYDKDFRAYTDRSNGYNVYLYHIPVEKSEVLLSWNKEEYLLDRDFGWDGDTPQLTIAADNDELTAETLGIVYSSSDTSVATVNKDGEITAKGDGECVITAEIPASNYLYKAEPAKYTLYVTSAGVPVFMDEMDGTPFEKIEIALLPSVLSAGYTFYVKAADGYDLNVTLNPAGAGKATIVGGGAYVTVNRDCTITARTKKGEQTSTRYSSFRVRTMDLAPAEISWTADRYVYDLATKQWNTTPELVNNYDLPVTYASNNERVAKVSATGKITPLEQGTAIISATVEGTDDYQRNVVTTTIRVTDSTAPAGYDVFEMVKKGDQLRENEQFIIVSGEPYNYENRDTNTPCKVGGQYYALTPTISKNYYEGVAVETPDGDDSGERLLVSDEAKVLRLIKQYDTSLSDDNYPFLFQVVSTDPEIDGQYIQVKGAKNFVFTELPDDISDRAKMNGNIRVLDPDDPEVSGYVEKDYINFTSTGGVNHGSTLDEFMNKGEILFKNFSDGTSYSVRFNPTGTYVHFNVFALTDTDYDAKTRSKRQTAPIRIYRLAKRVEKPSITVYPEEPVSSDIAYEEGVTYNNKVRVVIEQHPKTSSEASLMRQWQKEGRNPALPDYESFSQNQVVVYVDGNAVEDAEGNVLRYIDPDLDDATATRTLFAVSRLDDVYSESAEATFNFKTSAPRLTKSFTDENGDICVRVEKGSSYTNGAYIYYVISDSDAKPSVTFDPRTGYPTATTGNQLIQWSKEDNAPKFGEVMLEQGKSLWVGAFKAGYEPTFVEYNNYTIFPECRPMQLLRLTDKGREIIFSETSGLDKTEVFEGAYDPSKPLYINYRNDLVNEDGTLADSENHFHYLIQRDHTYGDRYSRQVQIEQISEDLFKKVFGNDYINVDDDHARNFLWTSDYYVFVLNYEEFSASLNEKVVVNDVKLVTPDRTYLALQNMFDLRPTNSDGTYVAGSKAEPVYYYGVMLENAGKLGAKTVTSVVNYTVGDGDNEKEYTTETSAETLPRIPSSFGFTFEYEYERETEPSLKADNPDAEFVKLSVPSAIPGKGNSEALININDLNSRHLNLIFKFNRPNISKHILQHYDIYYTIKFNRYDASGDGEPVRTLLSGSGVYVDNEEDEENDDAVYRFRIDDVHPASSIYPEIEISKVTYVGNSGNESYGQYVSNFGQQKTAAPAPNNSERKPLSIKELWVVKTPDREVDGKYVADWMYLGHSELENTPDIVVNNPYTDNTITINSSFYHIETYIPGTDYYSSYEYLVKHDDEAHFSPEDENHPYYSDNTLGYDAGLNYDAMRYTIIARDFPCNDDKTTITPKVVVSPVYFFSYGADMKPVAIDKDDKVINSFQDAGGFAQIVFVNDLPGAVSPTNAVRRKAPRRSASTGTDAPSTKEYPMPHVGDTDMNHASILDLTTNPEYNVVIGGHYEPDDDSPIMTGIENLVKDGAATDGKATYYNLQGVQVANPGHGFYIRVTNGQAAKVLR